MGLGSDEQAGATSDGTTTGSGAGCSIVTALADSTMPEYCRCTYKHHKDRRVGPRRANDRGELRTTPIGERRIGRGRRATDREE